ncbi:MAG: hypothetical protein ABW003_16470 [Microvirga sp.]
MIAIAGIALIAIAGPSPIAGITVTTVAASATAISIARISWIAVPPALAATTVAVATLPTTVTISGVAISAAVPISSATSLREGERRLDVKVGACSAIELHLNGCGDRHATSQDNEISPRTRHARSLQILSGMHKRQRPLMSRKMIPSYVPLECDPSTRAPTGKTIWLAWAYAKANQY